MPQHTHAHPQVVSVAAHVWPTTSASSRTLSSTTNVSASAPVVSSPGCCPSPPTGTSAPKRSPPPPPLEGREAIRTVMRELIAAGYLVREKHRDADGRFSTIQTIYEVPGTPPGETPEPPTPRKAKVGRARDGKTGAFTKNPSPRTETNNNPPAPQAPTSLGDALATVSSSEITREELKRNRQKIADLEAATLAVGLPASYSRIKPDQKRILLELIDRHGIDALAQAAVRAHRPENPTMHVHGWIRLWQAMSASGATRKDETPSPAQYNSAKCPDCDDIGMVMNENDLGVRCHCRTTRAAA